MNPEVTLRAAELRRTGVPFVHARVVRVERPTSAKPGDEAVVLPDGSLEGFVGGTCAEATVRAQSLSLLDSHESLLLRIAPDGEASGVGADGTLTVVNPCLSGGALDIFLEPVVPAPALAVIGESPIAAALVALAEGVGFAIAEGAGASPGAGPGAGPGSASTGEVGSGGDSGPAEGAGVLPGGAALLAAVVVASHGRDEEQVLEAAVRAGVPYVGLVASRKRGEAVLATLDLDEAQRAAVHTPAGLDIGARTPREVALSILAEIVSLRPRPSATPGLVDLRASSDLPAESDAGTGPGAGAGSATSPAGDAPSVDAPPGPPATASDLVCGMTVVADDAALHLDHEGARYWFCGSGCLRAFAADPGAYLPAPARSPEPAPPPGRAPAAGGTGDR